MTAPVVVTHVKIPRGVIEVALNHVRSNRALEVGGMFAFTPQDQVVYLPGVNVTDKDPSKNVEFAAEWIAEQIYDRDMHVLAFFHSHPGGRDEPSPTDVEAFPWYYVGVCLIYYGDEDQFVAYDKDSWTIANVKNGFLVEVNRG